VTRLYHNFNIKSKRKNNLGWFDNIFSYNFYKLFIKLKAMYIFIWAVILIFIIWIFFLLKYWNNKKLDKKIKKDLEKKFKKISSWNSSKEKIIDYDKLYHKILLALGYKWTFWNILKKKPSQIKDLNKIWELHKLRNKLVHDFDSYSETTLNKKAIQYNNIIFELLFHI